jgi:hypothetical protein
MQTRCHDVSGAASLLGGRGLLYQQPYKLLLLQCIRSCVQHVGSLPGGVGGRACAPCTLVQCQ